MGNHEVHESHKPTDSAKETHVSNLSAYAMDLLSSSQIKTQHGKDGSTTREFPTGVRVESTPAGKSDKPNVVLEPTISVESLPPNHMNKKGEVVDPKGRVIAKMNEDGSVTVDSGKGFYTQHPDGSMERESVIRSRDGKTFEIIDTKTPLGNLKIGGM